MARDCDRCDAEGVAHAPDCPELYAREHGGHVPCGCGPCAGCGGRGWLLDEAPEDPRQLALPGADPGRVTVDRCGECWIVRPVAAWRWREWRCAQGGPPRPVCAACLPAVAARVRRNLGYIDAVVAARVAREEERVAAWPREGNEVAA
jgi:hypothetical protein